ncbi:MAG: outer membrane protein transport protein [Sulfuritalea sp.]|nr:outer membrane protein transport protein [Sulfuritalea sp.]
MKLNKISALMAVAAVSGSAFATDGYFAHGYGMKAKGMGGAATAMASDSFGGANNPASMVWAGDRLDVGVDLFSPKRSASRTGSMAGIDGSANSGSNLFLVPEFGFNKMMGWDMSAGVTVYGNGGMNTNYPGGQLPGGPGTVCGNPGTGFNPGPGPFNLLCGTGNLGINLVQLVIAPTFSMKLNKTNSVGVSLLFGYQKFAAQGLDGFRGFTATGATSNLTNQGYDDSTGWGLRFGWMGQVSDKVTLGASYTSKMKMQKFDKYKDLFPSEGMFDMPEAYNLGIAVKATPQLTIAADYQRINYGGINSIANPSTNGGATTVGTLGCSACRGFGWGSVDVYKLGMEYQVNSNLTVRAGYNRTDNPITPRDVTFNIIAPGVVQDHYTLGFTYNVSKDSELTMAYMHAPSKSVTGASLYNNWVTTTPGVPGGIGIAGNETISMKQDSLGIAYGMKF